MNDRWFVDDINPDVWDDGFDTWEVPNGPFSGIRWWAEHQDEDEEVRKEAMAEIDFIMELVHEIERLQAENIDMRNTLQYVDHATWGWEYV